MLWKYKPIEQSTIKLKRPTLPAFSYMPPREDLPHDFPRKSVPDYYVIVIMPNPSVFLKQCMHTDKLLQITVNILTCSLQSSFWVWNRDEFILFENFDFRRQAKKKKKIQFLSNHIHIVDILTP